MDKTIMTAVIGGVATVTAAMLAAWASVHKRRKDEEAIADAKSRELSIQGAARDFSDPLRNQQQTALNAQSVVAARDIRIKQVVGPSSATITRPKPTSSIAFTVGYYNARVNWIAISAIHGFCLNKSGAEPEFCIKYLRASDLDSTLLKLNRTASRAGWPTPTTMKKVNKLNSSEQVGGAIAQIFANADAKHHQEKELESLAAEIERLSRDVLSDAHNAKADLGLVFLGNQIGKIDALLALGMGGGGSELEKLVIPCRDFIKAIFLAYMAPEFKLQEHLSWIIADHPNLSTKVDSMTAAEIAMFVGRSKDAYLMDSK